MNCEENDLAVVANDLGIPQGTGLLGAVVRVVHIAFVHDRWGPIWELETTVNWRGFRFNHIADSMLKPLRDPGEDAVDETLLRKPVPLPVIQPELIPERAPA